DTAPKSHAESTDIAKSSPRWTPVVSKQELVENKETNQTEPTKGGYPRGTIRGEVVLQFSDTASLNEAIRRLTEAGVPLKGSIRGLNMLRVAVPDGGPPSALDGLLGDLRPETSFNKPVELPLPIELPDDINPLLAFGNDWLELIGVTSDNSDWGAGVRIAVIDSGVTRHPALDGANISHFAMLDGAVASGHGNAVTSIIVGNGDPGQPRGLAPAAEILAYQAMDADGGDAFTIAESIVDAVDRGASIINLSLGGFGDNEAVAQAVEYAQYAGVVIVAAVGNDRLIQITYPAAYDGVIAVTAIDANYHWAEFPNAGIEGKIPDIAGPGVGITAAYEDDTNIAFTGTSAAAPAIAAAIAADMSVTNSSAVESANRILANASDRGEPGDDAYLGAGYLDMRRVMQASEPGIIDLAISDNYADLTRSTNAGLPVRIGVQNRGTETVSQSVLTVLIGNRANMQEITMPSLAPGETTEFEALIPVEHFQRKGGAQLGAVIRTTQGEESYTDNNMLATQYFLPGTDE
ncbi:MAG: S8 family peptidase, partial [Puniceicoccales bacterium]